MIKIQRKKKASLSAKIIRRSELALLPSASKFDCFLHVPCCTPLLNICFPWQPRGGGLITHNREPIRGWKYLQRFETSLKTVYLGFQNQKLRLNFETHCVRWNLIQENPSCTHRTEFVCCPWLCPTRRPMIVEVESRANMLVSMERDILTSSLLQQSPTSYTQICVFIQLTWDWAQDTWLYQRQTFNDMDTTQYYTILRK